MTTPLNEFVGQQLLWQQKGMIKIQYDLVAGDTVLATFDMSNWTIAVTAQVPEGILSLKREGMVYPQLIVQAGSETGPVLATFKYNLSGDNDLQFTDGRTFTWKNISFWGMKKAWIDPAGQSMIGFEQKGMSTNIGVFIPPESATVPDLSLLAVAGLYLLVVTLYDTSASTIPIII